MEKLRKSNPTEASILWAQYLRSNPTGAIHLTKSMLEGWGRGPAPLSQKGLRTALGERHKLEPLKPITAAATNGKHGAKSLAPQPSPQACGDSQCTCFLALEAHPPKGGPEAHQKALRHFKKGSMEHLELEKTAGRLHLKNGGGTNFLGGTLGDQYIWMTWSPKNLLGEHLML